MAVGAVTVSDDAAPREPRTTRSRTTAQRLQGAVGELFITAAAVLALYLVWQLFYTDVQSGRSQAAVLDSIEWPEPVRVAGSSMVAVQAGFAPPADAAPAADAVPVLPDDARVFTPRGAPVLADQQLKTTFAALHVPRWGADYVRPVSEGTSRAEVLDKLGIGHYEDTAMPGAVGNFAIAGHRTTYGKPFEDIATLTVGDPLVVQTADAWYVYTVTGSTIETPDYTAAIAPVPGVPGAEPTVASITLTTCHPKFSAGKRYIVWGELEYWAPSGLGYPRELVEAS